MKIKRLSAILPAVTIMVAGLSSCSRVMLQPAGVERELTLAVYRTEMPVSYPDLDRILSVNVTSTVGDRLQVSRGKPSAVGAPTTTYVFTPSVRAFALDATRRYLRDMRFDVVSSSDCWLNIEVKKFNLEPIDKTAMECQVVLSYSLELDGETKVPISTVSAKFDSEQYDVGLARAFAEAFKKIDWDAIANCLRVARRPAAEANARVTGQGNTALEHTVIRWYITSSPQGADVSWRVVSSTPDVANTNSNFVGTTPYESTESFDIKGLTYNNSGNVQIEVICERQGYLPQKKRFNLRQVIDQKEISAKFNLIKED